MRKHKQVRVTVQRRKKRIIARVHRMPFELPRDAMYVTDLYDCPHEAAIAARSWAKTHGFSVRYTAFEHGLVQPEAVGEVTIQVER